MSPTQSEESVGLQEGSPLAGGDVGGFLVLAPERNLPVFVDPRQGPGSVRSQSLLRHRKRQDQRAGDGDKIVERGELEGIKPAYPLV